MLSLAGSATLAGTPEGLAIDGDHAFAILDESGLHVVDISDLPSPIIIYGIEAPGHAESRRMTIVW